MHLAALTTCHNRRDKTLTALADLIGQKLSDGDILQILVVDDGGTDGTSEAIRDRFPEARVIAGSGDLFWAGGMRFGFSQLDMSQYDALLVFNDDVRLKPGAVRTLIESSREIERFAGALHAICGSLASETGGAVTYGGYRSTSRWFPLSHARLPPIDSVQPVDTFNMNFALIRREAIEHIGFLAPYFRHSEADIEFCRRLTRAGGRCWMAPGIQGCCERNDVAGTWMESDISRFERLRRFSSVKAWPFWTRLRYCVTYGGWFWPATWLAPYVRMIVFNRIK